MPRCFPSAAEAAPAGATGPLDGLDRRAADAERLLRSAVEVSREEPAVLGLLQHGSWATGEFDLYSDLDITCVAGAGQAGIVGAWLKGALRRWGPLLMSRAVPLPDGRDVLFCLFGPDLLRVDVIVKELGELTAFKEPPALLWDSTGGALAAQVAAARIGWPPPDAEDLDSGFWLDAEQVLRRIGRGELEDAVAGLGQIRVRFLGPMILHGEGAPPNGLRRIEAKAGWARDALRATHGGPSRAECCRALAASIDLYARLRGGGPSHLPLRTVAGRVAEQLRQIEQAA